MKILIVEDDFVIAESLASELKKWNYGVIVVEQFDDILSIFNQHQPQLVLLDINLPTLNGFHWCQEMQKHLMCQLYLLVPVLIIWTKLWQYKWEMILSKNHLTCH